LQLELGRCTKVERTSNELFDEAKKNENVLFHSVNASHSFIDALCRNGKIYKGVQITTGKTHSFSLVEMERYVEMAKKDGQEFRLYYLVLPGKLKGFRLVLNKDTVVEKKDVMKRHDYAKWNIYIVGVTRPDSEQR
jgi:hypothetical protein